MRFIEKWAKSTDNLASDDIIDFDVTKCTLPNNYFLNDSGKRHQVAYNKNSVIIYSDYNKNNGPVDGFILLYGTEFRNLFIKE